MFLWYFYRLVAHLSVTNLIYHNKKLRQTYTICQSLIVGCIHGFRPTDILRYLLTFFWTHPSQFFLEDTLSASKPYAQPLYLF